MSESRGSTNAEPNILVVDDDPAVIAALGPALQEFGKVRYAMSAPDALRLARQTIPDIILLDIELPGMSGFEMLTTMKGTTLLAEVPVIFITSDPEHEQRGLALGAVDFIAKPPRLAHVIARMRVHLSLKHLRNVLKRAATTDMLTGLLNRAQFHEALKREWLSALTQRKSLALLAVDVDCFRAFNAQYGDAVGDQCLRDVAQAVGRVLHRSVDVVARIGGNEFVMLLPGMTASNATEVARYAMRAVADLRLPHARSPISDLVTISVGITAYDESSSLWASGSEAVDPRGPGATLLWAAEQALSAAKHGGRNQARFLAFDDADKPDRALDLRVQELPLIRAPRHA